MLPKTKLNLSNNTVSNKELENSIKNQHSIELEKIPNIYELKNRQGTIVKISNLGASIVDFIVKIPKYGFLKNTASTTSSIEQSANYEFRSIVLGTTLSNYENQKIFLGATIGRFANRIDHGKFTLNNKNYEVPIFFGLEHALHGGTKGFDKHVFQVLEHTKNTITLSYKSPNGEMGFPGNLNLFVCYKLRSNNTLDITYEALTDEETPINITNHTYWNLNGTESIDKLNSALKQKLQVNSSYILESDDTRLPTGKFINISNTENDLRKNNSNCTNLSKNIKTDFLRKTEGYDHVYKFKNNPKYAKAFLESSDNKISLTVYSDYEAMQVYTGNYIPHIPSRIDGIFLENYQGIALEPEFYPNILSGKFSKKMYQKAILKPNQKFKKHISFAIKINKKIA